MKKVSAKSYTMYIPIYEWYVLYVDQHFPIKNIKKDEGWLAFGYN